MRTFATLVVLLAPLVKAATSPTASPSLQYKCLDPSLSSYPCSMSSEGLTVSWSYNSASLSVKLSRDSQGWLGFGFGTQMVGSPAVIGWCDSTPNIYEYSLNGEEEGDVNVESTTQLQNKQCSESGGTTTISYVRPLNAPSKTINIEEEQRVIFAWGSSKSKSEHDEDDKGRAKVNFRTGDFEIIDDDEDLALAHGVCMWIGFSLLLVSGIFVSRYGKGYAPMRWLFVHISLQFLALIFALAGLGIALASFEEPLESTHGQLGLAVTVLLICQIFAGGFLRPNKSVPKSLKRAVWEITHKGSGGVICFLGLINVLLGLTLEEEEEDEEKEIYFGLQIGWILLIAIIACVLEYIFWGKQKSDSAVDDQGDNMHVEMQDHKEEDIGDKAPGDAPPEQAEIQTASVVADGGETAEHV